MKILHLGKFYPPTHGGIERIIAELVQRCNAIGFCVDVLCANECLKTVVDDFYIDDKSFRVIRAASFGKIASTAISPMMIHYLRDMGKQYDIIHIHHPDPMAALALFLSGSKAKIVLQWHADILRQKQLLKFYNPLLRWLIRRADVVVGATKAHIYDSDYSNLILHKSMIIPFAIAPLIPQKRCIELPKQRFKIFALGRLVSYKGFRYLIESAKELNDDFLILIGGDGVLYDELKRQIHQLGLGERVCLLGALSAQECYNYFEQCDVFVLPSIERTEMFGIVQVEAMAFGKPIVSTCIERSAVSYVNRDGESGLVVLARDSLALANAFKRLKDDAMLYAKLSQGAKERVVEFLPENVIPQWKKMYEELM